MHLPDAPTATNREPFQVIALTILTSPKAAVKPA